MAWYEEFFGERYLAEYAGLITAERTALEVEAAVALLGLPPGARILDLCCGHGRHAVELAARGYRVCGQDLCPLFLERAEQAARERGVSLSLLRGDMRAILHEPPFDAVVNLFTAFGYFEDDRENQKVLCEIARVLRPGGRFLLDVVNRDGIMASFLARDWTRLPDGTEITMERRFDAIAGVNREIRTYHRPDGRTEQGETAVRLYTPTELCRMAREVGLEPLSVAGGLDGRPLEPRSTRIALLAERPA